jgi:hypothetical protein
MVGINVSSIWTIDKNLIPQFIGSRKKHSNSPKKIKYKSEHSSIVMRFRIKLDIMQFCYICSVGNFEYRSFINFH